MPGRGTIRIVRAFVVAGFVVAVLAAPQAAAACSIASPYPPPTPREKVDGAKRAVFGKVVSRTPIGEPAHANQDYRYRFRVIETYKGAVRRTMRLVAGTAEGTCEAGLLDVGERLGLLLYKRRGPWRLNVTSFISRRDLRASGYSPRR